MTFYQRSYTDSVPLTSEKKREKILTFGPLEVLFTSPSKIREARPKHRGKPQATGADAP